ncbi:MAG: hypothetical protein AB1805_05515 [Nitrospirota bacterium]
MAEQVSNELLPAPGQLWRNVRTGDVLFIYRRNGQIEGVLGDGRKKSDHEVMKIGSCRDGWRCVYHRGAGDGPDAAADTYEFRAL